ncbi:MULTISPECIES: tRNA (adenosine(37)-N6)-threonylcarbamoyltransferase complex ATPase subunit type 1 TsaE [Metabacillus]|uniref:tRNA (Adenosine(37)-N6)-threonylcarbamoyltransferase complex ATPase subunit type 1 TsaE n=1 Tax=Metabacillus hrfriensis TaxID=3048891 RepID=A0ACD4RC66_9BACI|nr:MULTISPECIES: tRNA (adenosine(37)-N6)-threonylcarbamoyltransferase complex ATPase subunit type 1 TsaE [Metabacillus]UAL52559.1 tRNA (adenosine(37)-N6)-threonylcarbamoyltransferase complex ATPase subunit type 1 TsaE [Metabacillus dongyingensis]UOK58246.1 tRNA (adenosine(37)-N6)-threonylcarbamoyltransferase complex ATPase subunit type 1 TsaE [Bacillus sp. OVS6]WHZ58086.1 tRNA (adenosine(37)-N6)-threonylcarbamoyltransferase complex ATPase subunit type 1 TsaE [Metabacillus sp. CT-WN-B3]
MTKHTVKTNSPDETTKLAVRLGELVKPGDVITLEGDLGAGKTAFTKGLAKGMGIRKNVNSPTFTIMKEYRDGRLPLYHMDVYRMDDSDEDLGFDEFFEGEGVTVVEWAHLIQEQLPPDRLGIRILRVEDESREIIFEPIGDHYLGICKELIDESNSD